MKNETILNLLEHYEFGEERNSQFKGPLGLSISLSEFVVVRRLGMIELVTDNLEILDDLLHDLTYFYLRTGETKKFFIPPNEEPDFPEFHEDFWDCECEDDFIHHKRFQNFCSKCCGAIEEEQPDSLVSEVMALR
ncbi:hypothetical protein [Leptospira santarosai]|uniref:hypothetical protein n=1 Tax=Leptospira santarosai TaxID=28183 RepID=UPI0002983C30|nr:hypothetical protein [Leptospira santarosai]EKR91059.1 hypothetical protein LEP1GSC163_3180 [Leptospira santarosai str. CBC379]